MSEKKTLMLYQDYKQHLELMDGDDVKTLMLAIFDYNAGIEVDTDNMSGMALMAFSFIKNQMDRDSDKYDEIIDKRREAGKKGGLAKASKSKQTVANASTGLAKASKSSLTDTVTDTDTEKDIKHICPSCDGREVQNQDQSSENLTVETADGAGKDKPVDHSTTLIEQRFDAFWAAYPLKVGKKKARAAWKKLAPTQALHADIMRALSVQKSSYDWTKDGGQFIPHPTTWLNRGGWEDELRTDAPEHTRPNKYISPEGYRDFSGREE